MNFVGWQQEAGRSSYTCTLESISFERIIIAFTLWILEIEKCFNDSKPHASSEPIQTRQNYWCL